MPPSRLPTGTVDPASAGTRTFPADRERAPAAGDGGTGTDTPPSPVVPRREHEVTLDYARERIAELERQNERLREHIHERDRQRRAVVDRYERLLDRRGRELQTAQTATQAGGEGEDGLLLRLARRLGLR